MRSRTSARRCAIRPSRRCTPAALCRLHAFGRPRRAPLARRGCRRGDPHQLGLARDDVLVETLRSPKQVEIRAKARGLKVPNEMIVSHPSGVSLVRSENARAPMPGRSELVRSFSEALTAFQEGGTQ